MQEKVHVSYLGTAVLPDGYIIFPFTTMEICLRALKLAKVGPKFCQRLLKIA